MGQLVRPTVTLYGHFTGPGSMVVVTLGVARALTSAGIDWASVNLRGKQVNLGTVEAPEKLTRDVHRAGRQMFRGTTGRAGKPISSAALLVGLPDWWAVLPDHDKRIGYHVIEGTDFIPQWISFLKSLDLIFTASTWGASVLTRHLRKNGIHVAPHGLMDMEDVTEPTKNRRFVHLCSSVPAPDRKGTIETIRGFILWSRSRPEARLDVVLSADQVTHETLDIFCRLVDGTLETVGGIGFSRYEFSGQREFDVTEEDWKRISFLSRKATPPNMTMKYLSQYQGVLAPSRAEGFGLIPLECRSVGLPVLTTRATGHSEHMGRDVSGVVLVNTGPLEPCHPVGKAPSITPEDISEGIEKLDRDWSSILSSSRAAMMDVRDTWTWERSMAPMVCMLESYK